MSFAGYHQTARHLVTILALLLLTLASARDVGAEAIACKREIARAATKFARAKLKALQKCEDGRITGKVTVTCPDSKASGTITKAASKLQSKIAKRCGGSDASCASTPDNDSLASIGWNIGACRNIESGGCNDSISHCGDIASCVQCIHEAAVDQAIALYYDARTSSTDPIIEKCQRVIGKETAKFYDAKLKALGKCNDAVLV